MPHTLGWHEQDLLLSSLRIRDPQDAGCADPARPDGCVLASAHDFACLVEERATSLEPVSALRARFKLVPQEVDVRVWGLEATTQR